MYPDFLMKEVGLCVDLNKEPKTSIWQKRRKTLYMKHETYVFEIKQRLKKALLRESIGSRYSCKNVS